MSAKPGVEAVVFDLSGTVIDYGSRGPALAFVELFRRQGVALSLAEARVPMGLAKRDHIEALLAEPSIAARWTEAHGQPPDDAAIESLYAQFTPLQIEILRDHDTLIAGVPAMLGELAERGIRYAATTGFESVMIAELIPALARQGFSPATVLTPDQTGGGRPAPWMMFETARRLNIYPMSRIVKVGDTRADVEEGRHAGAWTVSVVRSSNEVGLSEAEIEALDQAAEDECVTSARKRLQSYGPDYVIDRITDLSHVLDRLSIRISRGERP